jgi:hypothetical protein
MTLSSLKREICIRLSISEAFGGLSLIVKEELEGQGWRFEQQSSPLVVTGLGKAFIGHSNFTVVFSPEGKRVDQDIVTRKAYKSAKYNAAVKAFELSL